MKAHRLAKIFSLLPFAIYGVPIIMLISPFLVPSKVIDPFFIEWKGVLIISILFGWIPSLISSVLGIVFSALSLKKGGKKIFLILSCVNAVIGIPWGFLMFHYILSSDWWRFINAPPVL